MNQNITDSINKLSEHIMTHTETLSNHELELDNIYDQIRDILGMIEQTNDKIIISFFAHIVISSILLTFIILK